MVSLLILATVIILLSVFVEYTREGLDIVSFLIGFASSYLPRDNPNYVEFHRAQMSVVRKRRNYKHLGKAIDVNITTNDGYDLLTKIYIPNTKQPLYSVLMWIHGGGWVVGDVNIDDRMAAALSDDTNMVTVSITYRLAPEYPFPQAIDDSIFVLEWIKNNIHKYKGNPHSVYIAGESAGGNLAAALVARNLDENIVKKDDQINIKGVGLVYPVLAPSESNFQSYKDVKIGILSSAGMDWYRKQYIGKERLQDMNALREIYNNYLYAPINTPRKILAQFPPTIMVTCYYDPLRDEDLLFAKLLRELDVPVKEFYYLNSSHGFFGMDVLPLGTQSAVDFAKTLRHLEVEGFLQ